MAVATRHREEVKAAIRIAHGTIEQFADANGVKAQAVRDTLRGTSSSAKAIIAKLLGVQADQFEIIHDSTKRETHSTGLSGSHRLSAGVE